MLACTMSQYGIEPVLYHTGLRLVWVPILVKKAFPQINELLFCIIHYQLSIRCLLGTSSFHTFTGLASNLGYLGSS